MKIMQQELVEKLAAVKSAVPARASIPALNGVLVKDNTLTAYNLDYGITTTMSCNAEESFILPMAGIQMIESLPSGEMELKLNTEKLCTRYAASRRMIFPSFQRLQAEKSIR